ncbi:MAG: OmpA family protein [Acidobacteriaceae bacterium]|jgi:chemotaxis protein MotB|nr:OmpA family protein [Acidobacteriaceae bacterium]
MRSGRRRVSEPENHERWLVSYADFITLLFAFFVVMFASSQADKGRQEMISDSVKRALQKDEVLSKIAGILGGSVDNKGVGNAQWRGPGGSQPNLQTALERLLNELKHEIQSGSVQLQMTDRGLVVSLRQAAFFPVGDDGIYETALPAIERVAATLKGLGNPIRLEGHTDAVPIQTDRFRSNWDLSAARAISVMALLDERYHIARGRMAVMGYGDTVPIADNESEEGRQKNRRVDIVVLNEAAAKLEPHR